VPAVLVKIAYSARNSARTPLFCSLPEKFSALRALSILRKYGREPGPNPSILAKLSFILLYITDIRRNSGSRVSVLANNHINGKVFAMCYVLSFQFFLQLLCISLVLPYSAGRMLASKIAYSARNSAGRIYPSLNLTYVILLNDIVRWRVAE